MSSIEGAWSKLADFFLSLYLLIQLFGGFFDRESKTRNLLFGNDRHSDKIWSEKTDCDSGKDRETWGGSGILYSPPRSIRKEIPGVHQQVHRMMTAKFVFSFSQCIQIKEMMILCPPILCYKWRSAKATIKKNHFLFGILNDTPHGTTLCQRSHCSFHSLYNLHLWVFCWGDCTQQDNFFFQLIIVRKSCNLQKK